MPNGKRQHGPTANPGLVLRAFRKGHRLTLAMVSKRTGLAVSTLSKIENGKISLSYDKLSRLGAGLEIDVAQLFDPAATTSLGSVGGRRSVTRAGEGLAIETENYSHLYPSADLLNKRFVPIVAELHARTLADFGELVRHAGEEYAYVVEGVVELHTDMYVPVRLETGDSVYFDSGMAHAYIAVGAGCCRVLSICSATQSQLLEATGATGLDDAISVSRTSHSPPAVTRLPGPKPRRSCKPQR